MKKENFMQTYSITPVSNTPVFTSRIVVPKKLNKSREFLYNEVLDVIKQEKKPAVISNEGIDISNACQKVADTLKKLGIKFLTKED